MILYTRERKRKLGKLADILDVILDDDIDTVMERDVDESFSNVLLPFFIKKIRRELGVLQLSLCLGSGRLKGYSNPTCR